MGFDLDIDARIIHRETGEIISGGAFAYYATPHKTHLTAWQRICTTGSVRCCLKELITSGKQTLFRLSAG